MLIDPLRAPPRISKGSSPASTSWRSETEAVSTLQIGTLTVLCSKVLAGGGPDPRIAPTRIAEQVGVGQGFEKLEQVSLLGSG